MLKKSLQLVTTMSVMSALAFVTTASAETMPPGAVQPSVTTSKFVYVKVSVKVIKIKHGHKSYMKRVKVRLKKTGKKVIVSCPDGYTLSGKYCLPLAVNNVPPANEPIEPSVPVLSSTNSDPVPNQTTYTPDEPGKMCIMIFVVNLETGEDVSPCSPDNPRTKICNPDGAPKEPKLQDCSVLFPIITNDPNHGSSSQVITDPAPSGDTKKGA